MNVPDQDPNLSNPPPEETPPDGPLACCPACRYPIVGVQEAGMACCPNCGLPLEFDGLRRAARIGIDMSRFSYLQLTRRLFSIDLDPRRKPGPLCHFNELPPPSLEFVAVAGGLVGWSLALVAVLWPIAPRGSVFLGLVCSAYLGLAAFAHVVTHLWVRRRFRILVGADGADQATAHVMNIAATQYLPIAVNLAVFVTAFAALTAGFMWLKGEWVALPVIVCPLAMGTAAIMHCLLWLNLSHVVQQMIVCETFHNRTAAKVAREDIKAKRRVPATLVMLGGPLVVIVLAGLVMAAFGLSLMV